MTLQMVHSESGKDELVQSLLVHVQRHFIDTGQIFTLNHAVGAHVAERRHLMQYLRAKMLLRAKNEYIGLDTQTLQFLYRMLGGFRLQFSGRFQVRDIGEMDAEGVLTQFPPQLSDGLQERSTFNIADGSANLGNDKVELPSFRISLDPVLDLIGNMRNHLDGFTQIVAATLFLYHRLIDLSGGNGVVHRRPYAREALIMPQIQVGFHAIIGHITLSVLIRVERTRVDIDIGIELLNGHTVAARQEQASYTGRDNALPQGRNHTARNENIFGLFHN